MAMAWRADQSGVESTDHACAIRSMRASGWLADPSGLPSSKKARLNHCPSQAAPCSAWRQPCRAACHRAARVASPALRASGIQSLTMAHRNQASHTDSPLPSWPTRFMPSFQSPVPIRGRPCAPTARLRSMARAACSYTEAEISLTWGVS